MDKFVRRTKRKKDVEGSFSQPEVQSSPNVEPNNVPEVRSSRNVESNNVDGLEFDPALRINIYEYHPNQIEKVRRVYLQRGPCQPKSHNFPQTQFGKDKRRFNPKWFNEHLRWLEYSVKEDAAYCLCCYLFKSKISSIGIGQSGGDSFINGGFRNWKKKETLNEHVEGPMSSHNQCLRACGDLMKHIQHIEVCLSNQSEQSQLHYRTCLTAYFDCLRFLLRQGLAFRGHDESNGSDNLGNFLELMHWLAQHNDSINQVVFKNAPENHKITSPDIQKDLINDAASLTTKAIMREIGNGLFTLLVDESRDISVKEQMEC